MLSTVAGVCWRASMSAVTFSMRGHHRGIGARSERRANMRDTETNSPIAMMETELSGDETVQTRGGQLDCLPWCRPSPAGRMFSVGPWMMAPGGSSRSSDSGNDFETHILEHTRPSGHYWHGRDSPIAVMETEPLVDRTVRTKWIACWCPMMERSVGSLLAGRSSTAGRMLTSGTFRDLAP
jgi:hypothetical protein